MSTGASTNRPAVGPWLIALIVVIPTFMEILDTTIVNVALEYIAGGLSASNNDSEWVITSYLAANATILPISGWLSARLGRRNYFLISISVFTIASGLCGMATSLEQLILFRIIQGLGGGGLQPVTQAVLVDTFPAEKHGSAQALFGISALAYVAHLTQKLVIFEGRRSARRRDFDTTSWRNMGCEFPLHESPVFPVKNSEIGPASATSCAT
jgi:predicted MFS family arabinose efflux permease